MAISTDKKSSALQFRGSAKAARAAQAELLKMLKPLKDSQRSEGLCPCSAGHVPGYPHLLRRRVACCAPVLGRMLRKQGKLRLGVSFRFLPYGEGKSQVTQVVS